MCCPVREGGSEGQSWVSGPSEQQSGPEEEVLGLWRHGEEVRLGGTPSAGSEKEKGYSRQRGLVGKGLEARDRGCVEMEQKDWTELCVWRPRFQLHLGLAVGCGFVGLFPYLEMGR